MPYEYSDYYGEEKEETRDYVGEIIEDLREDRMNGGSEDFDEEDFEEEDW